MTERALTPAQADVLSRIPERFPPERIDNLWIFPPRSLPKGETGLFVLSLVPDGEDESSPSHRILVTIRYLAARSGASAKVEVTVSEEGRAPPDNIERVISGVLARAGIEAGDPTLVVVEQGVEAWRLMVERLGISA